MLRAAGYKLRGRRVQTVIFLFVVALFLLVLQRSHSPDQGLLPFDTKPHTGLLVTTSNDDQHPLRYLPLQPRDNGSILTGEAVPVRTGISPNSKQGVSHVVRHPGKNDLVYITNEVRPGSTWTGKLEYGSGPSGSLSLGIFGQQPSNGDLPAHSIVTRDGKNLLVTNYGSPTVSIHSIGSDGRLRHVQTVTLPRPAGLQDDIQPHPHHITQHPSDSVFYIADLGYQVVYVLRQAIREGRTKIDITQIFDVSAYGTAPRNGIVSADGRTYYLSFQTSSSVIALPLDRRRQLLAPPVPALTTLPDNILEEGTITSDGQPIHSASDIHLFGDTLLVANRRVKGSYPSYTGDHEDTIAVFHTRNGKITPRGHISTGCWKPREMIRVKGEKKDYLAMTCNGQFAQGGGVVLVDLEGPYKVVGRWDSRQLSPSGIVGLSLSLTTGL